MFSGVKELGGGGGMGKGADSVVGSIDGTNDSYEIEDLKLT